MTELEPKLYVDGDIRDISLSLGESAQILSGKTIALSGAGGFVGQYICATMQYLSDFVLRKPLRLLAYDNLITSAKSDGGFHHFPCAEFRRHDVIHPLEVDERVDYVIHAAGIASPIWYRAHPLQALDVSIQGTRNMLELARSKKARLLYFSSSEIYGDPPDHQIPTSEKFFGNVSCTGSRACYDEGKRVGETLCEIYFRHHHVSTVVVRPFNVFGPGMREQDYRVLPAFAGRIKAGLPLEVYGNGRQTRTFCYITDAITGFMRALLLGVPGEAYNIGSPTPEISMVDLARRLQELLGSSVRYEVCSYPANYPDDEPQRRCPDITRASKHLGYAPSVSLEEGLRRFLDWTERTYVGRGNLAAALADLP